MTNSDLTRHVFSFLEMVEVSDVIVCAGARNAPLVQSIEDYNFNVYSYFEERSASFFALGISKAQRRPVAIITTSGTAAAELLPAAIEAHYLGLPLILITADRPKSYRLTGSPQSIEQVGLYKNYVENEYDLDTNTQSFRFAWSLKRPIHLNVCFDEPLIDLPSKRNAEVSLARTKFEHRNPAQGFIGQRPLIILGEIPEQYHDKVVSFIKLTKSPVFAESLSQLRSHKELEPFLIETSDALVRKIFETELCDSVVRIGGVPTLRFWRDLEKEFNDTPVLNYTDLPFSGLSRPSNMVELDMLRAFLSYPDELMSSIKDLSQKFQDKKITLLNQYPLSEPAMVRKYSEIVGEESIYLGNSLPIRHWDQFALVTQRRIFANRGANGIDGQISTYLGWSENKDFSHCLVGDLTLMYDMAAFGLSPQLESNRRFVTVINNFGGQIFKRVFRNSKFVNSHSTQFYHLAKMWNWSYLQVNDVDDFAKFSTYNSGNVLVEIVPDAFQTESFWNDWLKADD